jgi:hypothetical protein
MESLLVEEEVLSRQTEMTAEKGCNFWSDRWIALKVLQYFPEPIFLEVPIESLLVEEEVLSLHTGITTKKSLNFSSDHWIAVKYLQ